ncbi:MAG TPA: PEP-CTERM sorting domain-containing protein [Rariglobus sp.]
MNIRITRLAALSAITAASFLGTAHEARSQSVLLSYWNFNNVSPAYLGGNGTLGSFSTSSAAYGEAYTQVNASTAGSLGSNTANGTVFNGSAIKIDLSNLGSATTPIINGKTNASSYTLQGQTNTTFGGYGAFLDDATNRVAGDTTTGGSLIIMNPSGTELGKYITFSLSSAGYNSLSLSFATRISGTTTGTELWSYSTDGTNFTSLASVTPTAGSFGLKTLDLSSLSSTALDNQSSFYLRMTIGTGTSASYALDNIQLTGTAISSIPEPSTYALLGGLGALGLTLARRRSRR